MAEPDFQPSRKTVDELLSGSSYYLIPRFQRPYSWDRGNREDFWRDIFDDNDPGYFIGPMVAWRRSPNSTEHYVVDGQQRLTTILILLATIRDEMYRHSLDKLANGLHRYIEKPNRDDEDRLTLQHETPSVFFNNAVLARRPSQTTVPQSEEDKSIATAAADLRTRLSAELVGLSAAETSKRLRKLRDALLALRVIWIDHGNENDAYVVFETLNSRGKDLEVVDLLKNLLLNKLRRGTNQAVDPARDQWTRVRLLIEESQVGIDFNRYVQHWWLSQERYVAQRKLFPEIKKKVTNRDQAQSRLNDLEADAPWYRLIYEPYSRRWGPEESEIPRALEALRVFGVSQPAPVILAILRARRDATVPLKHVVASLQTIERFHFLFTAIAQQSSSGGVSEMYAKYARELSAAASRNERIAVLTKLRAALVQRVPDRDVFLSRFVERLILTDEYTREKKLVQYVLGRIAHYDRPGLIVDRPTVEHLLPQDQIGNVGLEVVGSIGNLVWLPDDLNRRLRNRGFAEKKRLLAQDGGDYGIAAVLQASQWDAAAIRSRAEHLAERAFDQVWHLPVRM